MDSYLPKIYALHVPVMHRRHNLGSRATFCVWPWLRRLLQASDAVDPDIRGATELVGDKVWGLDNTKAKETYLCYGQQAEYRSRHIWPAALNRTESQSLLDPAAPLCVSSWYPFSVGEEKHPQQSVKEQIYGILCQL